MNEENNTLKEENKNINNELILLKKNKNKINDEIKSNKELDELKKKLVN